MSMNLNKHQIETNSETNHLFNKVRQTSFFALRNLCDLRQHVRQSEI